jgi:hypothetical protein
MGNQEALHRPVQQDALVAGEHVLEHRAEGPAGPGQGEHAGGQGQAKRPTRPEPFGQEPKLALVAGLEPRDPGASVPMVSG